MTENQNGKTKTAQNNIVQWHSNSKDISGQKFRMLTALYPTDKRDRKGTIIWHCYCDCGSEVDISYDRLLYSTVVSCGCRKKEEGKRLNSCLIRVAGTSVDVLRRKKNRSDNKSGVTGVYRTGKKYRAEICFQKVTYRLGSYDTLEQAAAVRYKAEQVLHKEFLDYYAEWKKRADANPGWAALNPVTVKVTRNLKGEFQLIMSPTLE